MEWIAIALQVVSLMVIGYLLLRNQQAEQSNEKLEKRVREELAQSRQELQATVSQLRAELIQSLGTTLGELGKQQKGQLDSFAKQLSDLTAQNKNDSEALRQSVEHKLTNLQKENSEQLGKIRETVDEKLQATLEQRLGESFKLVSDRLEQVHKGLGEMQTLANGVGDLKKVLTNVKTRGTLGEIQLGNILEQVLTPEQYEANVAVKKSAERVEFAIKIPAKEVGLDYIWLPIDSKFPVEDYQRLLDAQDVGDQVMAAEAAKQLEARIKLEGKSIRDKYISPPNTTDFAVLFLPTEGLYAEVLRRTGLFEWLQRECRVTIAGPTTLAALLNSLQMGFRTLAIQKRSSEVWQLLGAVKSEFTKFGDVLEKTKKKLQEATNSIEDATTKTRVIERKLKQVEELPFAEAQTLIGE